MKSLIYISFILFLVSCNKTQENATVEQCILKAEKIQDKPKEVFTLLKDVSSSNLDDLLSVRWCIVFGRAVNKLNKGELLSILELTKALKYCDTPEEKAWVNYLLGVAYYEQKNGYKSIEYYKEALTLANECKAYNLMGDINYSLGNTYLFQDVINESKNSYEQSVEMYAKAGNLEDEIRARVKLVRSFVYLDVTPVAYQYAQETERLAEKGSNIAKAYSDNALAFVYETLGSYDTAEEYVLKAIKLDTVNTASHYLLLASIYTKHEKYKKAHEILDIVETANSNNKHVPMTSALYRSSIYKAEGNMEAYEIHYQKYSQLREYFDLPVSALQVSDIEKDLNTSKVEILNLTKKQKFIITNLGLGFLVFSIILIVMIIMMRNQRRKLEKSYQQIINLINSDLLSEIGQIDNNNLDKIDELGNIRV